MWGAGGEGSFVAALALRCRLSAARSQTRGYLFPERKHSSFTELDQHQLTLLSVLGW